MNNQMNRQNKEPGVHSPQAPPAKLVPTKQKKKGICREPMYGHQAGKEGGDELGDRN